MQKNKKSYKSYSDLIKELDLGGWVKKCDHDVKDWSSFQDYNCDNYKYEAEKQKANELKRMQVLLEKREKESKKEFNLLSKEITREVANLFFYFPLKSFKLDFNGKQKIKIHEILIEKDGFEFCLDKENELLSSQKVLLNLIQRLTKASIEEITNFQDKNGNVYNYDSFVKEFLDKFKKIKFENLTEKVDKSLILDCVSFESQLMKVLDKVSVAEGMKEHLNLVFKKNEQRKKLVI